MSNTLNIGSKISLLRKEKSWSQSDLAQKIEASREIIGKYVEKTAILTTEKWYKLTT